MNNYYPEWLTIIPIVACVCTTLPLGWLARTKIGVYNTTKCGTALLFLTTLMICLVTLFLDYGFVKNQKYLFGTLYCLIGLLYTIGVTCFIVSILQLGLDQMPDASSSNIASFNSWILFSVYVSIWIGDVLYRGIWKCLRNEAGSYSSSSIQLWSLISVSCMGVVIVTDFFFAKRWLIIEPKTSDTIKIAYKVIMFAWKHKAPLNRSAFTYWEEDIPSRVDLGISRYGGPFTTEQVEDVKIVLRLLVLSLPLWVLTFSVNFSSISYSLPFVKIVIPGWTDCNVYILFACTYKSEWWILITTILFEFVIYPIVRERFPSILKRIGIVAFLSFVISILFFILSLVHHFYKEENISLWITQVLFHFTRGLQLCFLLHAFLDLVCAQAPYNTRGFFTGYFTIGVLVSGTAGAILTENHQLKSVCTDCNLSLILFGMNCFVNLFGVVIYCFLARWYKKRVRDEEYCTQRVVEEVYDRYLSRVDN